MGPPDMPIDAPWAPDAGCFAASVRRWNESLCDGPSFWLQLNLEDVPVAARHAAWPVQGVVWVFIDLSDRWASTVNFDPRPAASMAWHPRQFVGTQPVAAEWVCPRPSAAASGVTSSWRHRQQPLDAWLAALG